MKNSFLFISIALLVYSCKPTQPVAESSSTPSQTESAKESDGNYLLVVSFFSPGNGIDHKIKGEYQTFLSSEFPSLEYEKTPWGKEGEIDFCISGSSLTDSQKEELLKKTKEILSSSTRVRVKENSPCRHKK